jgi:hypothetical protein
MNDPTEEEVAGSITRRQALRRGTALGGAVLWATPVVQILGMSPALAQAASPNPPDDDDVRGDDDDDDDADDEGGDDDDDDDDDD